MATINLSITDDLRDFAVAQAERDGHPSINEYLAGLIHEERRRHARHILDTKLLAALDGAPAETMTPNDWDALEARVRQRQQVTTDRS